MRTLLPLSFLMVVGCVSSPSPRPAAACTGEVATVAPADILRVEPYVHVVQRQRGDSDREVRGARVFVRAQPGLTREWLQHSLECRHTELTGDTEVAIAVESMGDSFRVDLVDGSRGDQVLAQARTYASR